LLAERRRLEGDAERIRQDRAALERDQLQFNGAAELGRRQFQDEHAQLARERQAWQEHQAHEQFELRRLADVLRRREAQLEQVERELLEEREQWQGARLHLEKDIEGLQNRIRHQRGKLLEQQEEITRLETVLRERRAQVEPAGATTPAPAAFLPVPVPVTPRRWEIAETERLALLERLAGELADQRLHLAEQCALLAWAEEQWRQARAEVVAELDVIGRGLREREEDVGAREQRLVPAEEAIRRRRVELDQERCQLDAWQARLAARQAAWEGERDTLLARVQAREQLARRQLTALVRLRRRWGRRRRREAERFRTEHIRFQEARQQYATLWEDTLRRSAALDQEKRTLAERTLALEQYRLEVVGRATDAAAMEKHLERLRRRWAALHAEAERALTRDRQELHGEATRVEARRQQIEQWAAQVAQRETELSNRQTAKEHQQVVDDEVHTRQSLELESLRGERIRQERQLEALRGEVERMALTLLEQVEPPALPAVQAA
jgi:hypothetical protein